MDEVSVNVLEAIAYAAQRESMGSCVIRVELHTAGLMIRADGPIRRNDEPGAILRGTRIIPWDEFSAARFPIELAIASMIHLRTEVVELMRKPK